MRIGKVGQVTVLYAENGKCLVQKGQEQTIEDNDIEAVYLAKSLTPNDFEEKDKMIVEEDDRIGGE